MNTSPAGRLGEINGFPLTGGRLRAVRLYDRRDLLAAALERLQTAETATADRRGERTPAEHQSAAERRAYPRRDSSCRIFLGRIDELNAGRGFDWLMHGNRLEGEMLDLSMNGIAFLTTQPFPPGEHLAVRLENPHFNRRLDTVSRVVRCSATADGQWKVVGHFLKNLSFEEAYEFARHLHPTQIV